jgi:DNA topoisomerase-2
MGDTENIEISELISKDKVKIVKAKIAKIAKVDKVDKVVKVKKAVSNSDNVDNVDNINDIDNLQLDNLSEKYKKKTPLEHIKDLPDTYIGSIVIENANVWTLDKDYIGVAANSADGIEGVDGIENIDNVDNIDTNKDITKYHIISKEVEYVPGLRSIIEEILINAFDNMNRVNQKNAVEKKKLRKVSYIKVWTDRAKGQITIENDGEGIDVALHPEEKIYIPQMIFGELLTSGNYNKEEEKITGGKNGYGSKLTNIFSTYFKIETVDRIRKLKYTQEYRNNMDIKSEPIIENYKDSSFTRITFIPDYSKFKLSGMSEDLEQMIKKRTIDMFACSRGQLEVYHNNEKIKLKTFTDYMKLYLEVDHLTVSCKPNDRWEIGACMSPNFTFQQISFVNGINTHRGGKHVEYIVKQITKKMVDLINRKKKTDVKESFIKDNLMVFVNATIVNPAFDSQTKETLNTLPKNFGSECIVPDAFIDRLAESGIMDRALALSEFRDSQALKKTDGVKKKRILDIPKLDDAHLAGTKKGDQCTLILTEGDSAKAMAVAGISVIPNGHDLYGVFPLKGKMVNTRDKEDIAIANNQEICNIKKILALQEDVEYKDTSLLRYGRIMLMTDSDVDGSHIKGLLINFLSKWKSLMKLTGFITSLLTPIVKVWKKTNKKGKMDGISFYTISAYNDWLLANNNGKGYETKYYKGLGSSTPQEGKEYFKNFKIVTYHWDDLAAESVDMAFCKDRADDRKVWLADYDINVILDINQSSISVSDFINKDLIHFSNYDNHRSIPSVFDGLKPSLRKIIYCAFKRNLRSEIKVAQLAGYVSEHGAYHHGEASLNGAIINLAQNYVGTNNINLLMPEGTFGSRLLGGQDSAAPRYIFTYLSKITHILFNKDDSQLLKLTEDDGQTVEPLFYIPILPIILINGTTGIGTGWSSNIPQFNPLDILANIRNLMNDTEQNTLTPWYRGFTGSIRKVSANKWLTKGQYKVLDDSTIEITELPIGYWTQNFKELLEIFEKGYKVDSFGNGNGNCNGNGNANGNGNGNDKKKQKQKQKAGGSGGGGGGGANARKPRWTEFCDSEGKLIKSFKNECSDSQIKFTLKFDANVLNKLLSGVDKSGLSELEKLFQLSTSLSCGNTMNLYDEHNKLKHFKTPEEILAYYYTIRLEYYVLRRTNLIKILEQDVLLLSTRARFILDVINDVIKVRNVPELEIIKQLMASKYSIMINNVLTDFALYEKLNLETRKEGTYEFLITMPIRSMTKEKVEDLLKEKDKRTCELEILQKKTTKDIWEEDLKIFETEYIKHMDDFYEYSGIDQKAMPKSIKSINRKVMITKKTS